MSNTIHKTAIIEEGATIGQNVSIGPYCLVGSKVTIEDNVELKGHVNIDGRVSIGQGTRIFPFASLSEPQDLKYGGEDSKLIIGKNNVIREHVTINTGTEGGGMQTIIGDNCLFMIATHIAHDCIIGNNVIMANNATLGGHVHIGDFSVIGGLAAVHQFVRIGAHAIIGGMSGVESDVIPYGRVKGERAFLAGLNLVGLERRGFEKEDIKKLQKAYNILFSQEGTLQERIQEVSTAFDGDPLVGDVINFAKEKTRFPLCRPQKQAA